MFTYEVPANDCQLDNTPKKDSSKVAREMPKSSAEKLEEPLQSLEPQPLPSNQNPTALTIQPHLRTYLPTRVSSSERDQDIDFDSKTMVSSSEESLTCTVRTDATQSQSDDSLVETNNTTAQEPKNTSNLVSQENDSSSSIIPLVKTLFSDWDYIKASNAQGTRPLQYAVLHGRLDIARWLLENGGDVYATDNQGASSVHTAVSAGHTDIINLLLDHRPYRDVKDQQGFGPVHYVQSERSDILRLLIGAGASVDTHDGNGHTPLFDAVIRGDERRVALFANHGANLDAKQPYRFNRPLLESPEWTPIQVAAIMGHLGVLKVLIEKGVDINEKNSQYERNILHLAAREGKHEIVQYLIETGMNFEERDGNSATATHLAAVSRVSGCDIALGHLLKAGAEIEAQSNRGRTPLYYAAKLGNVTQTKMLLDAGANIEARGKYGLTPLLISAEYGNVETTELLLIRNADIHAKNIDGSSVLHLAASGAGGSKNSIAVIKLLLRRGASMAEVADKLSGRFPIHDAAMYGCDEVVKLFLDHGFAVDAVDYNGARPIEYAALQGQIEVARVLLERGADIRNRYMFKDVFEVAIHNGHFNMVEFLLSQNIDIDTAGQDGNRPLHWAAYFGNTQIAAFLCRLGADLNAPNSHKNRPIHLAIFGGKTELVSLLHEKKADINAPGSKDKNPRLIPKLFTFFVKMGGIFMEKETPCYKKKKNQRIWS